MAHEPHPTSNALPRFLLVDHSAFALSTHRPFNGTSRDADLFGNMHELLKREPTVGRVFDKVVEARGDVDDVPDFVTRESSPLLLRIHDAKCTRIGRSVSRQVDVDDIEPGQSEGTVPIAEMGRLLLIAGDAGTSSGPIERGAHVALHRGNLSEATHDDPKIALHSILLHNGRPARYYRQ